MFVCASAGVGGPHEGVFVIRALPTDTTEWPTTGLFSLASLCRESSRSPPCTRVAPRFLDRCPKPKPKLTYIAFKNKRLLAPERRQMANENVPGYPARAPRAPNAGPRGATAETHTRASQNCTQTEHTRRARGRAPHARQIGFAADGDAPHATSRAPRATRKGGTCTHARRSHSRHTRDRDATTAHLFRITTSQLRGGCVQAPHQDQRKVGSLSLLPLTFALALAKLFGHRLGRHDRVDRAEDDGPRRPRLVDYRHLCGIWKRRPARSDQNCPKRA